MEHYKRTIPKAGESGSTSKGTSMKSLASEIIQSAWNWLSYTMKPVIALTGYDRWKSS